MNKKTSCPEEASFEMIGPKEAEAILAKNTNNRIPSRRWIKDLADVMVAGEWVLNGESIIIDEDGQLLDGQQRLLAVVESGCTVPMTVIRGIKPTASKTIDLGRKRSAADWLRMRGESNCATLAAGVRALVHLERFGALHVGQNSASTQAKKSSYVSPTEVEAWIKAHPSVRLAASAAVSLLNAQRLMSPSVLTCLHYLFTLSSAEEAADFFKKLDTGEGLVASSPIYRLREKLTNDKLGGKTLPQNYVAALAIKAWNAFREGRTVGLLKVLASESLPRIA